MTRREDRLRSVGTSWALGVGAALLRLYVLRLHAPGDFIFSDMWVYDHRAHNLMSGRLTAWDTFTPCGYPWLLSVTYRLFPSTGPMAVGVLQALLGGATAALVHRIGVRMFRGGVAPVAAGVLTALHVPLVLYTGFLMTETPCAFLIALTSLLLLRAVERRAPGELLCAGLCLGAATVIRPNLLPFYPLLGLWLVSRFGWRRAVIAFALVGLGSAPLFGAAAAHHSRLVGRPSLLGTNGGLNFYLNFSEVRTIRYRDRMNDHAITPLPSLMRYEHDERSRIAFYDDAYYYRLGAQRITEQPQRLSRALRNLPDAAGLGKLSYWPGWPEHDQLIERGARGFFYLGIAPALVWLLWLAGSGRLFRPEYRAQALCGLWVVTCALGAWLFLGDPRLRVPFDTLLILLAVDAYAALKGAVSRGSHAA